MNYEPTCAYLNRSTSKKIGHPWKDINTSDLKLIWKNHRHSSILFLFFGSHRSEADPQRNGFGQRSNCRVQSSHLCIRVLGLSCRHDTEKYWL